MTSIGRIGNNSGLGLSAGNATEQASDAVILFRAWLDRGTQCTQGTGTHGCIFTHDVRQQAWQHCNTANMSRTHSAKTNWAVTERRLCPRCCHLGSYFYCASFTYHCIRWGIMCKHDIMNIQHSTVNMHDIRWYDIMPSVLSHCWLGGRKGMWPVKNWVTGCWHGYLSGVRCRLAYGQADATATHWLASSKIRTGFTFLVQAHLGSPRKRAVIRVCVSLWYGIRPSRPWLWEKGTSATPPLKYNKIICNTRMVSRRAKMDIPTCCL